MADHHHHHPESHAAPKQMNAGLGSWLFWGSLAIALVQAASVAFAVNRWLIARGRGHAVMHKHHHQHVRRSVFWNAAFHFVPLACNPAQS